MNTDERLLRQSFSKVKFSRNAIEVIKLSIQQYIDNNGLSIREITIKSNGETPTLAIVAEYIPDAIPLALGMCVHSLRSALDAAICTLISRQTQRASMAGFPIRETESDLRASFEPGTRICPDCGKSRATKPVHFEIRKHLPDLEDLIVKCFKPWKEGAYALWAIQKLDNLDKHQMIIPTYSRTIWSGGEFVAENNRGAILWEIGPTFMVFPGNFTVILEDLKNIEIRRPGQFDVSIQFPAEGHFAGQPVISTLESACQTVADVLDELEAYADGSAAK